jgi:SAM-dependent methyltransferase
MFVCSLDDLSEVFSLKNLPSMIPRYLKASPISSDLEETRLLELRKLVTLGIQNDCQENQEELLALLEAIAIQEFRLEFSTFVSSEEREELKKFEGTSTLELLLRACYTKPSRAEIEQLSQTSYQDLYESYRKELEIQEMPISCFDLSNSTSKIVACHYEEDPYPKWCFVQKFNPIPFSQFLKERLGNRESVSSVANFPEILVAGCGTGKVLVELLSQVQYQNATGIDLSVQSLQYSKYRLEQANLQNVELLRSDLLSLKDLGQSYDFIDCCGVLHHLEYPREGLKTLVEVLRGGSYMRLALYSRIARRNITLVRQDYQSSVPDRESIIQARHELRNLEIENPRRYVLNYSDFYSVSGCRDLLFHSCEHQFDLPELKELLDSGGLIFCGFEFPSRRSLLEYSQCYPQDPYGLNLANWHTFELENPDFFAAMYQFYVRKNSTRKL